MKVASYVVSELTKLIGYTIESVTIGDQGFPSILVHKKPNPLLRNQVSRYWIHIQCDAEGNGPGWANVEKVIDH